MENIFILDQLEKEVRAIKAENRELRDKKSLLEEKVANVEKKCQRKCGSSSIEMQFEQTSIDEKNDKKQFYTNHATLNMTAIGDVCFWTVCI